MLRGVEDRTEERREPGGRKANAHDAVPKMQMAASDASNGNHPK